MIAAIADTRPAHRSLWENGLAGTLPEDWSALMSLKYLYLTNGALTGTIPNGIADLDAVTGLEFQNNQLTGVIPNLPFQNYTWHCGLTGKLGTNMFTCPLPPGARRCTAYDCPLPAGSASCKQGPPTCSCTGSSASLPQSECEWWINFFDTMGGKEWKKCASERYRTDPCACSYDCNKGPCRDGVTCTNGHITKL
jgi:hypothetical protein